MDPTSEAEREVDLYELKIRRQTARTRVAIGIAILIVPLLLIFVVGTRRILVISVLGIVWLARGVVAWSAANAFEAAIEAKYRNKES